MDRRTDRVIYKYLKKTLWRVKVKKTKNISTYLFEGKHLTAPHSYHVVLETACPFLPEQQHT